VAEIDKSPIQPCKDRSGLMVRPGEATAKQRDFQDAELINGEVEGIHQREVDIAIVLILRGPN
jgi:hypothetical protein